MMFIFTILLITLSLFYIYCIKPMSYWKERGVKQTNPIWLFGDTLKTVIGLQKFHNWYCELYYKFPNERYFGLYQMTNPVLMIRDPELIKQVAVKDFDHFVDHVNYIPADPLWSNNLFALTGQKWRDMRPVLSPFFTSSKMKSMFELMSQSAKRFANFFLEKNQDIVEVECKDIFSRFCSDNIATFAFGIEVDSFKEPNNKFFLMGKETTDMSPFWRRLRFKFMLLAPEAAAFFNIHIFGDHVKNFFYHIVNETIKARNGKDIVKPDLIHLLTQARENNTTQQSESDVIDAGFAAVEDFHKGRTGSYQITNEEMASHAMVFFFGGADSNSSLMSFIAYELAVNPDIQERLRREVVQTMKSCDGNLTYEALMKMKYLDMVVSEALRKWPNTLNLDRKCTRPYTIESIRVDEKPVHLQKGDTVWIPAYVLHYDEELFPDPLRFDPERFSDENKGAINRDAYLPFGLGPRNCIGSRYGLMENKIVMFNLLYNFEIVVIDKSPVPLVLTNNPFQFVSENGFWFGLKRLRK